MKQLLHTFIPHHGNGYRPHAIRKRGLSIFAALMILCQLTYNFQAAGQFQVLGYATGVSNGGLLSSTNAQRSANGMSSFTNSYRLSQAAQAKANHMIANDYWDHYAPDGTSPWFFIESAGYAYQRAGENLAFGFSTSDGVVTGWMNSPGHRANILDSTFTEVGFGFANGSDFQGGENTVVVAMYAEPLAAPTPPPAPKPKPEPEPEPVVAAAAAPTPPVESAPVIEDAEPPKPKETVEETPEEEVAPVEEVVEEEMEEANQQRLLARLADDGSGVIVTGGATTDSPSQGQVTTNYDALLGGDAHWSLYTLFGGMVAMGFIYFMRHLQAVYQIIRHGEHYVEGHPTLEASLIYVSIWVMLFATYGAIL